MYAIVQPELFGTKGIEYLVVISFLLLLTVAWQLIRSPAAALSESAADVALQDAKPAQVPDQCLFTPEQPRYLGSPERRSDTKQPVVAPIHVS